MTDLHKCSTPRGFQSPANMCDTGRISKKESVNTAFTTYIEKELNANIPNLKYQRGTKAKNPYFKVHKESPRCMGTITKNYKPPRAAPGRNGIKFTSSTNEEKTLNISSLNIGLERNPPETPYASIKSSLRGGTRSNESSSWVSPKKEVNVFKCPLCEEPFDREMRSPKLLRGCGHTYCLMCLGRAYTKQPTNRVSISTHVKYPNVKREQGTRNEGRMNKSTSLMQRATLRVQGTDEGGEGCHTTRNSSSTVSKFKKLINIWGEKIYLRVRSPVLFKCVKCSKSSQLPYKSEDLDSNLLTNSIISDLLDTTNTGANTNTNTNTKRAGTPQKCSSLQCPPPYSPSGEIIIEERKTTYKEAHIRREKEVGVIEWDEVSISGVSESESYGSYFTLPNKGGEEKMWECSGEEESCNLSMSPVQPAPQVYSYPLAQSPSAEGKGRCKLCGVCGVSPPSHICITHESMFCARCALTHARNCDPQLIIEIGDFLTSITAVGNSATKLIHQLDDRIRNTTAILSKHDAQLSNIEKSIGKSIKNKIGEMERVFEYECFILGQMGRKLGEGIAQAEGHSNNMDELKGIAWDINELERINSEVEKGMNGVEVNISNEREMYEECMQSVDLLWSTESIGSGCNNNSELLESICKRGDIAELKQLISILPSTQLSPPNLLTIFIHSLSRHHYDICELLYLHFGLDLNSPGHNGETPLSSALKDHDTTSVHFLIHTCNAHPNIPNPQTGGLTPYKSIDHSPHTSPQ